MLLHQLEDLRDPLYLLAIKKEVKVTPKPIAGEVYVMTQTYENLDENKIHEFGISADNEYGTSSYTIFKVKPYLGKNRGSTYSNSCKRPLFLFV